VPQSRQQDRFGGEALGEGAAFHYRSQSSRIPQAQAGGTAPARTRPPNGRLMGQRGLGRAGYLISVRIASDSARAHRTARFNPCALQILNQAAAIP